jgi:trans-aconitate 2-methyltransferase
MAAPDDTPARASDTWSGDDYARHSSLQEAMAAEVLSQLVLRGDEQLLDLGCGDGRLSARIAQRLPQGFVLGVDASPDMVAYAQRRFPAAQWPGLRFEVADARHLDFESRFDRLVSFNALHWVPQQEQALRGIRRALRPQGRAHLRLVTRCSVASLEEVAEQVRQLPEWAADFAGFSDPYLRLDADQYVALARRLGLGCSSCRSAMKRWDFGSEEGFFGFCHAGFGAWTRQLPEVRRTAFVEQVMRRYLAGIAADFGERFVFHFNQTDLELLPV